MKKIYSWLFSQNVNQQHLLEKTSVRLLPYLLLLLALAPIKSLAQFTSVTVQTDCDGTVTVPFDEMQNGFPRYEFTNANYEYTIVSNGVAYELSIFNRNAFAQTIYNSPELGPTPSCGTYNYISGDFCNNGVVVGGVDCFDAPDPITVSSCFNSGFIGQESISLPYRRNAFGKAYYSNSFINNGTTYFVEMRWFDDLSQWHLNYYISGSLRQRHTNNTDSEFPPCGAFTLSTPSECNGDATVAGNGCSGGIKIIYVDADATGANDGSTWANAYTTLQSALAAADGTNPTEIWVAQGTYYPTGVQTGTDRNVSFVMKNNTAMYGGFAGTESSVNQRNIRTNPTTLSGNIGDIGINADNSYHVIFNRTNNLDNSAVLDGFTISSGNADGTVFPVNSGGGMFNSRSSPSIANCTFSLNSARIGGAILNTDNSSPNISQCIFTLNSVANNGGAIFNTGGTPEIEACFFRSNFATDGAGIYSSASAPRIENSVFTFNQASNNGAAIFNSGSSYNINNCTFSANTAFVQGSGSGIFNAFPQPGVIARSNITINNSIFKHVGNDVAGDFSGSTIRNTRFILPFGIMLSTSENNISADPQFRNQSSPEGIDGVFGTADDGLQLADNSPCINTGNNSLVPTRLSTDILGNDRILFTTVDMGAYEVSTMNSAPVITAIDNQTTCDNTTLTFEITVTDADMDNVTISATSSNMALVSNNLIDIMGTGNTRTISITPETDALGTTTITLTPRDGTTNGQPVSFELSVGQRTGSEPFLYIPNRGSNTVSLINTTDNSLVSTIDVGISPTSVASLPDGSKVYIVNLSSSSVSVINTSTRTVETTIEVGSQPTDIVVSPQGDRVYVSNQDDNTITVINVDDNSTTFIDLFSEPLGLAISNDGSLLYVTLTTLNRVIAINTTSFDVVQTVQVGERPISISVSPDGSLLYVVNVFSSTISKVNATSFQVLSTIVVGTSPFASVLSPDGSKLYVTESGPSSLAILNTSDNSVLRRIDVGETPSGVSISGNRVYTANSAGNSVSVIDAENFNLIETISGFFNQPIGFGNFVVGEGVSFVSCNQAPTITSTRTKINACQDTESNSTNSLFFTLADDDDDVADLSLTATSSNNALIDASLLGFTGSGASRSIVYTPEPGQTGTAIITVTVTDPAMASASVLFTIDVLEATNQTITVSNCDSLSINGVTYYETGVYTQIQNNQNGCPVTLTINATIGNTAERTITAFACDGYTYRDITYTESGTYVQRFAKNDGCDSVLTFNLTIGKSNSSNLREIACDSYTLNGTTYNQSGEYTQTLTNVSGCDSTINLSLTILNSSSTTEDITACDNYFWDVNGETYRTSGTYTVESVNENGCPRLQVLNLTINSRSFNQITETACDSYTLNDVTYTNSGSYTQRLRNGNALGCDSIIRLELTILRSSPIFDEAVECDSYTWAVNGQTYTQTGTYTHTFTNDAGCASTATLNLTINQSRVNRINQTACESFTLNGQEYTQSGTYTQLLETTAGCDSSIILSLTILQPSTSELNISGVCDVYELNGTSYTESGTYEQTIKNAAGCDSTITLNLTLGKSNARTLTISECESLTINGETFTNTGTYTQNLTNASGCDSTLTINLTIDRFSGFARIERKECSQFTFGGVTYTQSGTYRVASPQGTSACDSTELVLTINQPSASTITQTACNFVVINNVLYEQSGTFKQVRTNAAGCDSVITLNLTILKSTSSVQNVTACDSYTLGNQTYSISGTYKQTISNAAGCDSLVTLNLTINRSSRESVVKRSACESFTWAENGETYTKTGLYRASYLNKAGCDSSIVLDLTINKATQSFTAITSCERFTWSLTGNTYTESTQDTAILTNAAGCDSLVILNIEITPAYNLVQNVAACGNFIWPVNGTNYDKSGTYQVRLRTKEYACDSIITLNLVIVEGVEIDNTVDLSQIGEGILTANAQGFAYQWLDCNNEFRPIPGATNRSFNPTKVGSYAVVIQGPTCSVVSDCINVLVVGIENISESQILVYPNPSAGVFTIDMGTQYQNSTVVVYDLLGKQLRTVKVISDKTQIDLSEYAKGNYMLHISNNNGSVMKKVTLR